MFLTFFVETTGSAYTYKTLVRTFLKQLAQIALLDFQHKHKTWFLNFLSPFTFFVDFHTKIYKLYKRFCHDFLSCKKTILQLTFSRKETKITLKIHIKNFEIPHFQESTSKIKSIQNVIFFTLKFLYFSINSRKNCLNFFPYSQISCNILGP